MTADTIPVRPHTVSGTDRLNEAMARAYLAGAGYEAETGTLIADAQRFPGTYGYTADRRRYVAFMPGAWWLAGDCAREDQGDG